jgi:hypothetical protein
MLLQPHQSFFDVVGGAVFSRWIVTNLPDIPDYAY